MHPEDVDVAVIGGGAAGLTASGVAASFGARTVLVERARLGGDCTWTGCIPSKALLHAARGAASARRLAARGIRAEVSVDFPKVLEAVRGVRQRVYAESDAEPILARRGVAVIHGAARFTGPRTLVATGPGGERTLRFRRAVIATGSAPRVPDIPGLAGSGYLTNESVFELTVLPGRLVVLGAGPQGMELAQAFASLGSRVTVVARGARVLPRDEPEASAILQKRLEEDGVTLLLDSTIHRVERSTEGLRLEVVSGAGGPRETLAADALLVASGRRPNLDGLDLERAGVRYGPEGIAVDAHGRTSARGIHAAGDAAAFLNFTHVADDMARAAAVNAVFGLPLVRYETRAVPWTTFTDPGVGHVGRTAEELRRAGARFETIHVPAGKIDRAVAEGSDAGFVRVYASPVRWFGLAGGKILGACVVGPEASESISLLAVAMRNGVGLSRLSRTVLPYPAWSLGVRRAADQVPVRLQRPWMVRLVRGLYRYRGTVPATVGSTEVL